LSKPDQIVAKNLKGIGASRGTATGKALVFSTLYDYDRLRPGYILIARHATPDLFPFLEKAAGVVCYSGGRLCHMAILCRELCIPCVTGVKLAPEEISNDMLLEIDGLKGSVTVRSDS
jgi:pyruvate, water dikinase